MAVADDITIPESEIELEEDAPDLITQTDRYGNSTNNSNACTKQPAKAPVKGTPGLYSKILFRVCCCFGLEPPRAPLLPPQNPEKRGKKCLILDLDETLVHSAFARMENPDHILTIKFDQKPFAGKEFRVFVLKRPGLDDFLRAVSEVYEIVIFTASLEKYAGPLLEELDSDNLIDFKLYRSACTEYLGNYVKDLRLLGRDLKETIIVDNSPASYQFQRENAIGCSSFIDDHKDRELHYCKEFLLSPTILGATDVRTELKRYPDFILHRKFYDEVK